MSASPAMYMCTVARMTANLADPCAATLLQIQYIAAKLGGRGKVLPPDLAHLARELAAWCEREAAARTAALPSAAAAHR